MTFISRLVEVASWCIARVRVNKITRETIEGRHYVRKKRSRFGWFPIFFGNLAFKFRGVSVGVLHQSQWLSWERAVHEARGVTVGGEDSRSLLLPRFPGRPLLEVFHCNSISGNDVIEFLALAIGELYQMHQLEIVVDGDIVLFSHGDASITNVLLDWETRTIVWLDFDLRHDLKQPAVLRQADDLRAFVNTTVQCLAIGTPASELFETYMEAMKRAYPCEATWQQFYESKESLWNKIDLFASAQKFRRTNAWQKAVHRHGEGAAQI